MEIFSFITESGLPPLLLFILFIIIAVFYFFGKNINLYIKSRIGNKQRAEIKDLKSHDIFNTLQRVKQEVYFLKFYTHGNFDATKTAMCQDFVKYKCEICDEHFEKFAEKDFSLVGMDQLKSMMLDTMYAMHSDYIKATKNHWLNRGISKEDADFVILLFEKFRHDVVLSFQHRIDAIFACEHYDTKFKKILACYDMFAFGIDLLPKDLQTTFEAVNGRFAQINYR